MPNAMPLIKLNGIVIEMAQATVSFWVFIEDVATFEYVLCYLSLGFWNLLVLSVYNGVFFSTTFGCKLLKPN